MQKTVNIKEEYKNTQMQAIMESLHKDLVGLEPVKKRIQEIAALLLIERLRKSVGYVADTNPGLHMSFTGSPGTGKTTVALMMANILSKLGYIKTSNLLTVTRDDLVGQYIGHTAPKTKEVLKKAMGGVLFIDEAYYLYKPDNERDYGSESIEILLQVMENQREDLVVILAGYKERMDVFYESNPGLASRIANHVDFPDYESDELLEIGKRMLQEQQYLLTEEAETSFLEYIEIRKTQPFFANARSVKNALDRARMRQAIRICESDPDKLLTKRDLVTICEEDVRQSRVFALQTD
jgi:probable Rubsico expression protein CbbX|nr:Rubisco expression protein [Meringosphaera mediterranea]WLD06319.1 Rubisco expression protein [Meringosphaera mediterranea]